MATVGRGEGVGFLIASLAEAQVEARVQQLTGQGGAAAETVDGPFHGGLQLFVQSQHAVEGAHHVERHGQVEVLGQKQLPDEPFFLHFRCCSAQKVHAAFPQSHNLRVGQEGGESVEKRGCQLFVDGPPGMDACGIERTRPWTKQGGLFHPFLREVDDGLTGRGFEMVGVEVHV